MSDISSIAYASSWKASFEYTGPDEVGSTGCLFSRPAKNSTTVRAAQSGKHRTYQLEYRLVQCHIEELQTFEDAETQDSQPQRASGPGRRDQLEALVVFNKSIMILT